MGPLLLGILLIGVPILTPIALVAGLHWVAKNMGKKIGIYVGGFLTAAFLFSTVGFWSLATEVEPGSRALDSGFERVLAFYTGILFVCSTLTTYRINIRY